MFGCFWKWFYLGFSSYKMVRLIKIVSIFFLLTFHSFSQKLYIPISDPEILKIYKSGEKLSDGEYLSKDYEGNIRVKGRFNKITPIGKWYIFFKNGNLMAYYNYNDQGELDGIFVEYYDNSQLKISGYFVENLQSKLWQTFYKDGVEETAGEMLDGKRYKTWLYYHPNGKIKEVSNYNVKGRLDGDFISYDKFGTPISKAFYTNNKIDGEYYEFYFNEKIALKGYYNLGLKDSVWIEFGPYGRKSFEKRYRNDLPHSKWIYYYENNGSVQKEEHYTNGIKNGNFKEFYPSERIAKSYNYINNLLNGEYKEYLPYGYLSVKGEFLNNLKTGLWETYNEDGEIFSIGRYINDYQNGDWKYFHKSGNISSEGKFINGFESGKWISYFEGGELDEVGEYVNGLKDGIWGRFNINGEVKQEEIYNLGKLISVSEFKLLNGQIITNSTFKDGAGELIDYYENGDIFSKSNYLDGELDGYFVEFHSNGKISQRGSYRNNEKVGLWYQYNRRGSLINKNSYD